MYLKNKCFMEFWNTLFRFYKINSIKSSTPLGLLCAFYQFPLIMTPFTLRWRGGGRDTWLKYVENHFLFFFCGILLAQRHKSCHPTSAYYETMTRFISPVVLRFGPFFMISARNPSTISILMVELERFSIGRWQMPKSVTRHSISWPLVLTPLPCDVSALRCVSLRYSDYL